MTVNTIFIKDPDAVLDYAFDWADWLADGESISTYTITAEIGITKDSDSRVGTAVVCWFSGGTAGEIYSVVCHITTSDNRQDDRTMFIQIEER